MLFRRRSRAPKRRRVRKLRFLALVSVLGFVALVSFAYGLVSAIASDVGALEPSTNKRPQQLGYIYASDGKTVLATLYLDNREIVDLPDISEMGRDRKSTRLNSSHVRLSRMPSSA